MNNDYRYPNITAADTAGKIEQIRSYLHQLVDKLNVQQGAPQNSVRGTTATPYASGSPTSTTKEDQFNEIKSLIIKSADIADAFYESYCKKLEGSYVAQSEFGTFTEEAALQMEASAKKLELLMTEVDTIISSNGEFQNETLTKITQIEQQANGIEVRVQSIQENGASKVVTGAGYKFSDEGLVISRENEEIENKLDHTGMYVNRGGTVMLQANSKGVVATDVSVRNYLTIGDYARFEDYSSGSDSKRTACFHIGG